MKLHTYQTFNEGLLNSDTDKINTINESMGDIQSHELYKFPDMVARTKKLVKQMQDEFVRNGMDKIEPLYRDVSVQEVIERLQQIPDKTVPAYDFVQDILCIKKEL